MCAASLSFGRARGRAFRCDAAPTAVQRHILDARDQIATSTFQVSSQ